MNTRNLQTIVFNWVYRCRKNILTLWQRKSPRDSKGRTLESLRSSLKSSLAALAEYFAKDNSRSKGLSNILARIARILVLFNLCCYIFYDAELLPAIGMLDQYGELGVLK